MGDLKPLSFSVGIKDNTKKKLEEIERRFSVLKDKTITVNVAGGTDKELAENLTAATEAFKELKNAVGTGKPLNTIAKKAAKAQEAIDKLSTSLKTLGSTITGNEELNQFVSGLGNIIRAVNADLRELKSPGAFKGFAKEAKDAAASANKAEIEIAKLTALQNRMRDTVTSAQKVSLDTTDLERAIQKIETIKNELRNIKAGGGVSASGLTTSKYMGSADVQIGIMSAKQDMSDLSAKTREIERLEAEARRANEQLGRMKKTTDDVNEAFRNSIPSVSSFKHALASVGGVYVFQQLARDVIRVRGEMEQMEVAITSLVGSTAKADVLIKDLKDFARMSPLTIKDLMEATQTMIGFGVEVEKIPRFIRALGDVTLGNSERFKSITLAFSQMTAAGRLMGQDNLQFINAGFNPLMYIAEKTGKTMKELRDEMQKGAISTKMVEDAFISATEAGGRFYQMSEKTSQTVAGQMNKLRDSIYRSLNDFGEKNEGVIMDSIKGMTYLIDNYEQVGRVLVGLVVSYGTYRTAVILATAAENGHTLAMSIARLRILATQKAQALLNATMLTNPYVAAATALGVLVGTLIATSDGLSASERAQKNFNDAMKEASDRQKEYNQQTENAITTANSDTAATDQRREALNLLIGRYPSIIQKYIDEKGHLKDILALKKEIATIDGNNALKNLNDSRDKSTQYASAIKRYRDARSRGGEASAGDKQLYSEAVSLYLKENDLSRFGNVDPVKIQAYFEERSRQYGKQAQRQAAENATKRFQDTITNMTDAQLKTLQETLKRAKDKKKNVLISGYRDLQNVTLSPDDVSNLITYTGGIVNARQGTVRDKAKIEEEKKAAQATLDALSIAEANGKKGVELRKKIAGYNKELEAYSASKSARSDAKEDAANVKSGEAAEKLTGEKLKQAMADERARIDMIHSTRAAEIGAMEESTRKTLAQIELDRERKLEAIKREYEDLKVTRIENAKKLWDADPKNKGVNFYESEAYKTASDDSQYTQAQKDNREAREKEVLAQTTRAMEKAKQERLQIMYDYLKQYGTIQQRRYAIEKEYNDKILKATDENQKKILEKQKQEALARTNAETMAMNIDWGTAFSSVGTVLKDIAKETLKEVEAYMQTAEFKALTPESKKTYTDLQKKLRQEGAAGSVSPFNFKIWGKIDQQVKDYQKAVERLKSAQNEHTVAVEALKKAEKQLAEATDDAAKEIAKKAVETAKKQVEETAIQQQSAQQQTDKSKQDLTDSTNAATQGLQNFASYLNEMADGSLFGFANGISKLITSLMKGSDGVGKALGELGGEIGGLIGAILQILDALGDDPSKFIDDLLNHVISAVDGILNQIQTGELVRTLISDILNLITTLLTNSWEAAYNSVMNPFAVFGIGDYDRIFAGNSEQMEKEIEELSKSNERLAEAIESLSKRISDSNATSEESEKAFREAYKAEKEWQKNQREAIDKRASEWTSTGYGFLKLGGISSFNANAPGATWEGWKTFNRILQQYGYSGNVSSIDSFWHLTPEEMRLLKDFAPTEWRQLFDTDGHHSPEDLVNAYIERAGMLDQLTDALNEKLTGYSWDSFKGSYVDMLKNLDSTNKDFANNLEDMLTNAILNSLVNDVYKSRIKKLYKMISDAAGVDSEGGSTMTKDEIDAIRAYNEQLANDMIRDRDALISAGVIKNTGDGSSSQTLSAGIKGVSEQTADLLAGYVNAIRADVSVNRAMIAQYFPMYYNALTSGNESLRGIENHTAAIMRSNDVIAEKIGSLENMISGLRNKTWKVPIA